MWTAVSMSALMASSGTSSSPAALPYYYYYLFIFFYYYFFFDSLQLSGVLLGNVYCVSATPSSLETQHFPQQLSSSKDGP